MTADAVAVVIVTHESAGHIGDTLNALVAQLRPGDELIVVDNDSTDARVTVGSVRAAAPGARVVQQDNRGFAGGARRGGRAGRPRRCCCSSTRTPAPRRTASTSCAAPPRSGPAGAPGRRS